MTLDYESLRMISWALLILGVIGFALCEGLVLGVNLLLPLVTEERQQQHSILAKLTPLSLNLQIWLILLLTLSFCAWPGAYAIAFFSFQLPLSLMLVVWLARTLGFFYHAQLKAELNLSKVFAYPALLVSILLGLITGNLLKGIPFHFDSDMQIYFLGDFWGLVNPFALLVAAVTVSLFALYGAAWLQLKHTGQIRQNSRAWLFKAAIAFIVLFALTGLWITRLEGYHITSTYFPNGVSNPLNKFVKRGDGLWMDSFEHQPSLWVIPALAFIGAGASIYLNKINQAYYALLAVVITLLFTVLTVAVAMFPFLIPSNRSLNSSLTIWDASASYNTLSIVLWVSAIGLPLWLIVTRWMFWFWRVE